MKGSIRSQRLARNSIQFDTGGNVSACEICPNAEAASAREEIYYVDFSNAGHSSMS